MEKEYSIRYRFNHPTLKVFKDDADRGHMTYQIRLARNDRESVSLTFWTNDPVDSLTLKVNDFVSPGGHTLKPEVFRLAYINAHGRLTPDAMVPDCGTFSLSRDNTQMFLIRASTLKDTPAGDYSCGFCVLKDGKEISRGRFCARVWDFALPDIPSCGTLFGLDRGFLQKNHNADDEKTQELYKRYYDFLLENKICARVLPFNLLDDRADEYLNNDAVKNFQIPYSADDDVIRAYYKKLSSKPSWFQKGVFNPVDEPSGRDRLERYRQVTRRLEKLYPGFQLITPLGDSRLFPEGYDNIEFLSSHQTHWCLRSDMFDLNGTAGYVVDKQADPNGSILEKFGNVLERMEKERAGGDKIWWYVCGHPYLMSYCDLNLHNTGAQHRVLFWQQHAFDIEGILYWRVNYWKEEGSPWTNPVTCDPIRLGDGSLLYNGNEAGLDGPVGSLRLEMTRCGINDFEYLTMAKKLLQKERLESIINPVVNPSPSLNMALQGTAGPGISVFCDNDDTLYEARCSLGDAIESALQNGV